MVPVLFGTNGLNHFMTIIAFGIGRSFTILIVDRLIVHKFNYWLIEEWGFICFVTVLVVRMMDRSQFEL